MNRSAIAIVNDGRKFTFIEIINGALRIAGARLRGSRRAALPRSSPQGFRPHPCVTAPPLSLEERPLGRVSKDEASELENA
jgi:hypothetical protein